MSPEGIPAAPWESKSRITALYLSEILFLECRKELAEKLRIARHNYCMIQTEKLFYIISSEISSRSFWEVENNKILFTWGSILHYWMWKWEIHLVVHWVFLKFFLEFFHVSNELKLNVNVLLFLAVVKMDMFWYIYIYYLSFQYTYFPLKEENSLELLVSR